MKSFPVYARLLCVFFFGIISIYSQSKSNTKTIYITLFSAYKTAKNPAVAEQIFRSVEANLKSAGYRVVLTQENNLKGSLESAKNGGGFLLLDGYYRQSENGNLSIYGQIYNPESGYVIDALNITDEVAGLEGISLDQEESKVTEAQSIRDFSKKITVRLRTNIKRVERRENILESVTNSSIGKDISFQISKEDVAAASIEVFKLIAEHPPVSVASNVVSDVDKQPASVSVISRKQIELSGARTLNEVLTAYVPGFFTVEDQDDRIAGFRGLASDANPKVLLLLNGFNMNTEWQFGPPDSIINSISLQYIERIEVIRGPGSVTLGQGALLGVINIITKNAKTSPGTSLSAGAGKDGYRQYSLQAAASGQEVPDLKAHVYFSDTYYQGQKIKNEGWAHQKYYEGAEVQGYDIITDGKETSLFKDAKTLNTVNGINYYQNIAQSSGSRLLRTENTTFNGVIQYKGFEFNGFYANQLRDNYQFYRDRNEVKNVIKTGNASYKHEFSDKVSLKVKSFYTQDDYGFQSHNGFIMAGVRENRYGGSSILNVNLIPNNSLAIGTEFRKYDMGLPDENGNNFLINRADQESFFRNGKSSASTKNTTNKFVYTNSITVASFFVEDFYKVTDALDVFGAFRYDKHPYWGSNVSPRFGALYAANKELRFRASYQEGFRGAVGVAYTGGYQKDGLLSNRNFDKVQSAGLPKYDAYGNRSSEGNIPNAAPEKMKSFELAAKYRPNQSISFDVVGFYNHVLNVIDVGVICGGAKADCSSPPPRIGTDEPGDWNGYFFFRNTPGTLKQGGGEFSFGYKYKILDFTASHSLVRALAAEKALHNSQYLTSDTSNNHFKAYPENVSRLNLMVHPHDKLNFAINYLYYYSWYSPQGQRIEGGHVMNGGIGYAPFEYFDITVSVKNILNSGKLWPMNSNAGGRDLSSGYPAYETRTYWISARYTFQ